jgi:hypothetical protein
LAPTLLDNIRKGTNALAYNTALLFTFFKSVYSQGSGNFLLIFLSKFPNQWRAKINFKKLGENEKEK